MYEVNNFGVLYNTPKDVFRGCVFSNPRSKGGVFANTKKCAFVYTKVCFHTRQGVSIHTRAFSKNRQKGGRRRQTMACN